MDEQNDYVDFNIIDIASDDIQVGQDYFDKGFSLTFYGKTKDNKDVATSIIGFQPYFYIRLTSGCSVKIYRETFEISKRIY